MKTVKPFGYIFNNAFQKYWFIVRYSENIKHSFKNNLKIYCIYYVVYVILSILYYFISTYKSLYTVFCNNEILEI